MQDPCAIAVLYSTHFPYIEFQDCEGDHAKVIYKYVKMYLKIPLVISFVENEMVKRGMDTSVGQHVLNSMWSLFFVIVLHHFLQANAWARSPLLRHARCDYS
jgi:hypothetical protein